MQAYLHECLESVLEQPFTDLELIAIDDCSPDGSGTIIDEFPTRDPRVHAVHLTENVGLGRARNADLERAVGEYLIFLDAYPEQARWRPLDFRRMLDHFSTCRTARDRLPRGSRAAFLRQARTYCRCHRSPGAPPPARTRIRHALVRRGAQRSYRALCSARALQRRVRRVAASGAVRAAALQIHYRVQRLFPLRDNDALLSTYRGRGYGCNPAAIEAKVRELTARIHTAWTVNPALRPAAGRVPASASARTTTGAPPSGSCGMSSSVRRRTCRPSSVGGAATGAASLAASGPRQEPEATAILPTSAA